MKNNDISRFIDNDRESQPLNEPCEVVNSVAKLTFDHLLLHSRKLPMFQQQD